MAQLDKALRFERRVWGFKFLSGYYNEKRPIGGAFGWGPKDRVFDPLLLD